MEKIVHEKNFEQWSSLSDTYHNTRPIPPAAIINIILSWLQAEPNTVVDVGCGTGLSTLIWNNFAGQIVGIEPNDDMREAAERNIHADHIIFQKGVSNETNLPSSCADVITVSQAFHWMDIDSTLSEFFRVLKPGGVLAIYDFAQPPIVDWEVEKSFSELRRKCSEIVYSQEVSPIHNDKSSYDDRIKAFGNFRYSRTVSCHSVEKWTLKKLIGFFANTSNSSFAMEIDAAIKKDIDAFLSVVKARCSDDLEIIFPYNMVIAKK